MKFTFALAKEWVRSSQRNSLSEWALRAAVAHVPASHPFVWRMLPQPRNYKAGFSRSISRHGLQWRLEPMHYAQWYQFYGLPDPVLRVLMALAGSAEVAIDVGANVGLYALPMAQLASRVVAFEPAPNALERLREHVSLNRLENVKVEAQGVGDSVGQVSMREAIDCGKSTMRFVDVPEGRAVMVPITTLDEYCGENFRGRVGVLKIDVEGLEGAVLRGARRVIARDQPAILAEISPHWSTETDWSELQRLVDIGYRTLELSKTSPATVKPIRVHDLMEGKGQRNILCLQEEHLVRLRRMGIELI